MHSPGLLRDEPRFSSFHESFPILVLNEFTCTAPSTGTCTGNGSGRQAYHSPEVEFESSQKGEESEDSNFYRPE
jgi:hypothetical protein